MAKSKYAHWIHANINQAIKLICNSLEKYPLTISFKEDASHVFRSIYEKRPNIILLSELEDFQVTVAQINELASNAASKAIPIILILQDSNPKVLEAAAANGIRNFLHISAPYSEWERILSSSISQKPHDFNRKTGQVGLNHLCEATTPIRFVSLKEGVLRFESSIRSQPDDRIVLSGLAFSKINLETLEAKISKVVRSHLFYRFSYAYEIDLKSILSEQKLLNFQKVLVEKSDPNPTRIFTIIKNRELKEKVHTQLTTKNFHVNTAVQIRHILEEPEYLTPHIIIIERYFTQGEHLERFKQLISKISAETQIIVLTDDAEKRSLEFSHPNLEFFQSYSKGENKYLIEGLEKSCKQVMIDPMSIYVHSGSDLSYGKIHSKCHIKYIHPNFVTITSSVHFSQFTLACLDSSFFDDMLNAPVWFKITGCYSNQSLIKSSSENFAAEGDLVGLTPDTRAQIASTLIQILSRHFTHFTRSLKEDLNDFAIEKNNNARKKRSIKAYSEVIDLPKNREIELNRVKPRAIPFKPSHWNQSKNWRNLGIASLIILAISICMYFLTPVLEKDLKRSGKVYIDNLIKYKNSRKK